MSQEDKNLLLIVLSVGLPYGIKVLNTAEGLNEICKLDSIMTSRSGRDCFVGLTLPDDSIMTGIEMVKPYLRPMSFMTEEECDMVEEILGDKCIFDFMANGDIVLKQGQFSQNKLAKLYDYYNSIHVDYRGLIPMGLAIEAPEGMYDIK